MIKMLSHKWSYRALIGFLVILSLNTIIRCFMALDNLKWFKWYSDVTTLLASICTVGAFILTIDIYKESKEISKSVDKVIKSKNFELTEYREFMKTIDDCVLILQDYIIDSQSIGTLAYKQNAYDLMSKLQTVNIDLQTFMEELCSGLDQKGTKKLTDISDFINDYAENFMSTIINNEQSSILLVKLNALKAMSRMFKHSK